MQTHNLTIRNKVYLFRNIVLTNALCGEARGKVFAKLHTIFRKLIPSLTHNVCDCGLTKPLQPSRAPYFLVKPHILVNVIASRMYRARSTFYRELPVCDGTYETLYIHIYHSLVSIAHNGFTLFTY